jgi:hypothetical protein
MASFGSSVQAPSWPHFINTMVGFWGFQYTQLQKALQLFTSSEADAYMAVSDAMIDGQIQSIIDMAKSKRLPTMLYEPGAVAKGGLATYSADFKEVGLRKICSSGSCGSELC